MYISLFCGIQACIFLQSATKPIYFCQFWLFVCCVCLYVCCFTAAGSILAHHSIKNLLSEIILLSNKGITYLALLGHMTFSLYLGSVPFSRACNSILVMERLGKLRQRCYWRCFGGDSLYSMDNFQADGG